jgi:hypothetical protein
MFASASMYVVIHGQFAALLTTGFVSAGAMWVGALKPNIGLAMLAYRPSVRGAAHMLLFAALTLVLLPSWPLEWVRTVQGSRFHYAPFLAPGGLVLLASLLRWRRPEARLLAAMAVLPSSPIVYEVLPLFVVTRTPREMAVLITATWIEYWIVLPLGGPGQIDAFMARGRIAILICYAPVLVMVLMRPHEGAVSGYLERVSGRLPRWLRGERPTMATES